MAGDTILYGTRVQPLTSILEKESSDERTLHSCDVQCYCWLRAWRGDCAAFARPQPKQGRGELAFWCNAKDGMRRVELKEEKKREKETGENTVHDLRKEDRRVCQQDSPPPYVYLRASCPDSHRTSNNTRKHSNLRIPCRCKEDDQMRSCSPRCPQAATPPPASSYQMAVLHAQRRARRNHSASNVTIEQARKQAITMRPAPLPLACFSPPSLSLSLVLCDQLTLTVCLHLYRSHRQYTAQVEALASFRSFENT